MTPRHIYLLATFYTLMMVALTELGMFPQPGAIILAVANVWFWMGRLSCRPPAPAHDDTPQPKLKWGRQ